MSVDCGAKIDFQGCQGTDEGTSRAELFSAIWSGPIACLTSRKRYGDGGSLSPMNPCYPMKVRNI